MKSPIQKLAPSIPALAAPLLRSKWLRASAVGALLVAAAPLGYSAAVSWTGTGADLLWSTAANWSTAAVPTSADDVTVGPTFTSGVNMVVGGSAVTPTQINSLIYDGGTTTGVFPQLGQAGYLQINSGSITVPVGSTKTARITTTELYLPAAGAAWVINGTSLQIASKIQTITGGSGVGTTITKTGTGTLSLDVGGQTWAGNWAITGNVATNFTQGFGTGRRDIGRRLDNRLYGANLGLCQ